MLTLLPVDQSKSTTCQTQERPPLSIQYLDKSAVAGNYLLDTLTVGDCKVPNFSFAAATWASASIQHDNFTTGILGLNAAVGKSECFNGDCTDPGSLKPTISEAMASAGCIGSSSYSLFLDEDNARSPSVLFGGVDTARFTGPLVTLRTKPHANEDLPDRHLSQALRLAKVTARLNGTAQQTYRPAKGRDSVVVDTGAKGIVLAADWVSSIFSGWQQISAARKTSSYGTEMLISCDDIDADVSLDLTFADETARSVQVNIPLREMVVPLDSNYRNTTLALEDFGIPGANASNLCAVNILPSTARHHFRTLLGDPFFRSAYTYNNLDQNTISIARPANNPKAKERIIPIGRGPVPKLYGTG